MLWRAFSDGNTTNVVSIPQLIEKNSEYLRSLYLAWVYELGESRLQDRRVIDHLQLRPNFSYWWMTLLVEKCNFSKSPLIVDAIRMLAFIDWTAGRSIASLTVVTANQPLAECLDDWCKKSGIQFDWQRLSKSEESLSRLGQVYAALPMALTAWVWLAKHLFERWPLRGVGMNEWRRSQGRVTFFTYSDNCVPETIHQGRYENRYWAGLPEALRQEACPTNWLHIYVKDSLFPTVKQATTALRTFNQTERNQQCHVALDTFLGISVVFRTLGDWLRLIGSSFRLGKGLAHAKELERTSPNLWPLMRQDWQKSTFGVTAMENLLYLNLLEAALKRLPKQQHGVYLMENQGWEFGLIQAWRAAGHGCLTGAPHSTVRFWDLRYFFDPRNYKRNGCNDFPMPNQVACNGPVMRESYRQGGYPVQDLLDVEALRYLYLGETYPATNSVRCRQNVPSRLLVLGDYMPRDTLFQIRLLERAVSFMVHPLEILVKPHPNCPIHLTDYPALRMRVTTDPISKLLAECDVVYAGAVTSAAVDAYCAGVPLISFLNPNTLNLSPLRGFVGVLFADMPEALASGLASAADNPRAGISRSTYFTIDAQLSSWRRLLL